MSNLQALQKLAVNRYATSKLAFNRRGAEEARHFTLWAHNLEVIRSKRIAGNLTSVALQKQLRGQTLNHGDHINVSDIKPLPRRTLNIVGYTLDL